MSPRKTLSPAKSYQCPQYQQSHLSRAQTNPEMPDEEEEVDDRIGRTLFCKGLTQEVTQSILYELFLFAGPIQCVYMPQARVEPTPPGKVKDGETAPLGKVKDGETAPLDKIKDGETAPLDKVKDRETVPLNKVKDGETAPLGKVKDEETAPLDKVKDEETALLDKVKDEETLLLDKVKDGECAPLNKVKDEETAPLDKVKDEKTLLLDKVKDGETAPLGEVKDGEIAPLVKVEETAQLDKVKDGETLPLGETKEGQTAPLAKAEEDEQQACNTLVTSKTNSTYEKAEHPHVVSSNKQSPVPSVADPSTDKAVTMVESSSNSDKQDKATLASLIESSGIGQDILDCTHKVTDAISVADDKPFSFKDKILPRYKNKEHQGYAFIIFCHAQSVAYAINIYRGTKLYGSQLSMSPALQAMYNMRMNKKPSDNSNTEKGKNESCHQITAVDHKPSHLQASSQSSNQGIVYRNTNALLSRGSIVYNDQRNMPVRNSERFIQNGSPSNIRPINGVGNSHGRSCYTNNSQMSQVNWRARPVEDYHNVVECNDSTSSGNVYNERCYWRSNLSSSDADTSKPSSRGIYGNSRGAPTPQAGEELNHSSTHQQSQNKSMSDFQRKSILLARVAQLDLKKKEISNRKDNPIMEDGSFLSLTPPCPTQNEDLNESRPSRKIPSLFSQIHQGSSSVKNLPNPLKVDDLGSKNSLTICGDEHVPILHYEIDKHLGTQHYLNDTLPDCQQASENWDVQPPRSATILAPVYRGRSPQCPQRIVDPNPDRQSTTQYHQYYAYDHQPKLSDLRSYETVQCLDAVNPYAHIEQCYRGELQSPYRHPLHYQVNNLAHFQSREQFVGQVNRLGLDCDANGRPSAVYTRTFGPPSPRRDDDRDIHRTKSMPCHLAMNNSLAKACRPNACMDDPSNGQWVSPIAWKAKQLNAYQKRIDTKVSPRNINPINMKQGSSPRGRGSLKRYERQYTLSECFDTAFTAYQHRGRGRLNGAPNSSRGKPGGSPKRTV